MSFLPDSAYQSPSISYFVSQGESIALPASQNITMAYTSTVQSYISFSKNGVGDIFENLGAFNTIVAPSTISPVLSVLDNLNRWDSVNVGNLLVSGNVEAGTEVVIGLTNDGSGNLLVGPGSLVPLSIKDNVSSIGGANQVLSAGATGGESYVGTNTRQRCYRCDWRDWFRRTDWRDW